MSRRYIPVAAKREALRIYRNRRRCGGNPLDQTPLLPLDAMRSTVRFFAGHYAAAMAYDKSPERAAQLLDGYRAAEWYLSRLYAKPWRWMRPLRSYAELSSHSPTGPNV